MVGKCWVLLWLPLSLLAAERDPFQPVEDPCRAARLAMAQAGWVFCRTEAARGDGCAWMSNCPRAGG